MICDASIVTKLLCLCGKLAVTVALATRGCPAALCVQLAFAADLRLNPFSRQKFFPLLATHCASWLSTVFIARPDRSRSPDLSSVLNGGKHLRRAGNHMPGSSASSRWIWQYVPWREDAKDADGRITSTRPSLLPPPPSDEDEAFAGSRRSKQLIRTPRGFSPSWKRPAIPAVKTERFYRRTPSTASFWP